LLFILNIYYFYNYKIIIILNNQNDSYIGDWGLGIGDWGLGPITNPQSQIPNPQSPFLIFIKILFYE